MAEAEEGSKKHKWGYQLNTSSDSCISAINAYYHQVLSYGRGISVILEAAAHDPHCVLANTLSAHFLHLTDHSRAQFHLHAAQSRLEEATSYEKAIFDVIHYLMKEDRDDDVAIQIHFKLLKDFPRDLVSLKRAQLLCFYIGRPDLSLKFVEQVVQENQQEEYVYGMLAFPLLELGRMRDAEEASRKGLQINNKDVWSQHCLCHVLQHACRFEEAVEFMKNCSSSWSNCLSFMYTTSVAKQNDSPLILTNLIQLGFIYLINLVFRYTHNWWHVALCYLEGNSPIENILDIYDHHILKELERSDAAPAEVFVNALGLLMRLALRGKIDVVEDRLKLLVRHLTDQATWYLEWQLDLLTLWALVCTGELAKAEELIDGLRMRLSCMNNKKRQLMQRAVLLAEALYMYCRGKHGDALKVLGPDFSANDYKMIGASDEQLDVFNEVWYNILLSTGQIVEVIEEIKKRVAERGGVPFLWRLLERAYSMAGSPEAKVAGEKARALETAYFK